MKIFQKGFHYSQDGPGNRLVLHLQGCNMSCPWCSNPEGLELTGTLIVDEGWLYDGLCPYGAVKTHSVNRNLCVSCKDRVCVSEHRGKGIRLSCENYGEDELMEFILSSRTLYYGGGGVTFTGGEATLQFKELFFLLKALKKYGIDTALESNATHENLSELFPYIDHLILDCKLINPDKHKKMTGLSNKTVLENISKAAFYHKDLHIRIPMIGGVNNSAEEMDDFIHFFHSLKQKNVSYEILRYHELGKDKWRSCGFVYSMDERAAVNIDEVHEFKRRLQEAGFHYRRT